jgi:hypothetical protein
MNLLVDTPVWSLALRRKHADLSPREEQITQALKEVIRDGRARLVGVAPGAAGNSRERFKLRDICGPLMTQRETGTTKRRRRCNRCRARGSLGRRLIFDCAIAARPLADFHHRSRL